MRFATYRDMYSTSTCPCCNKAGHGLPPLAWYNKQTEGMSTRRREQDHKAAMLAAESLWWANGRPYFNVWPSIRNVMESFPIEKVPVRSLLSLPEPHIVVQLESGMPAGACGGRWGDSVIVSVFGPDETGPGGLVIGVESHVADGGYDYTCGVLAVTDDNMDATLGESLATRHSQFEGFERIAISVLLLERDPSIIEPDILAADRDRYELADADRRAELAERAFKRRGQRGYHVGRLMETIPHYRRPHPCLVWTGKGRATAKVVMRAGAVVKRQRMTESPTGYYGSFGEAEHDNSEGM